MKTIATLLSLLILLSLNMMLLGQDTQKKQMHIKVQKEENGVMTTIDTVITADNHEELHQMLKEMGLETHFEMKGSDYTWFNENHDGEHPKEMKVKVMKIDGKSGEGDEFGNKKMMMIHSDGEQIEIEGLEEGVKVFKIEEGAEPLKWEELDEEDRKKLEEMGIDPNNPGNIHKLEGTGDHNVIIHKKAGEGKEGEETHGVMFIGKPGEAGEMKITVELSDEESENGKVVMEKTVKVAIFLKDVDEADKEVLKRSGVEVNDLENSLSIEQLSFYPNPSNGLFNLSFEAAEEGDVNITVVNAEGRKVYEENLPAFSGRFEKQIDLSGNASGVYFLNLTQNGKVLNKKLVLN